MILSSTSMRSTNVRAVARSAVSLASSCTPSSVSSAIMPATMRSPGDCSGCFLAAMTASYLWWFKCLCNAPTATRSTFGAAASFFTLPPWVMQSGATVLSHALIRCSSNDAASVDTDQPATGRNISDALEHERRDVDGPACLEVIEQGGLGVDVDGHRIRPLIFGHHDHARVDGQPNVTGELGDQCPAHTDSSGVIRARPTRHQEASLAALCALQRVWAARTLSGSFLAPLVSTRATAVNTLLSAIACWRYSAMPGCNLTMPVSEVDRSPSASIST